MLKSGNSKNISPKNTQYEFLEYTLSPGTEIPNEKTTVLTKMYRKSSSYATPHYALLTLQHFSPFTWLAHFYIENKVEILKGLVLFMGNSSHVSRFMSHA